MGFERKSYRCKDCGKRRKAWVGSLVYKEKLCPACLDQRGLGFSLPGAADHDLYEEMGEYGLFIRSASGGRWAVGIRGEGVYGYFGDKEVAEAAVRKALEEGFETIPKVQGELDEATVQRILSGHARGRTILRLRSAGML